MGDSAADVVTAHVSLFTECVEGTNELGVFPHGKFQRLNDSVVMTFAAGAVSCGRKGRRRGLQCRVISDGEPPIVRHILYLAVIQVLSHNSKQIGNLLLAAFMRDEPA